jgi:hypothetical protein
MRDMGCASFGYLVGVIIFYSVRFLLKKNNQIEFKKKTRNRFKPTGFGSVILEQKPVQTDQFCFGSVFFRFGLVFSVSGLKN